MWEYIYMYKSAVKLKEMASPQKIDTITSPSVHLCSCKGYDSVPFNVMEQIKIKISFREYFNFLFAYVVITYYSLQFLSNGDTK